MAKVIDITDKLSFDSNPCLRIKGKNLEVNADAPTMLKVMALMGDDDPTPQTINNAYNMMFPEKSRKTIETLKLSFGDLVVVIQAAVQLIVGKETDGQGEQ